MQMLPKSSVFIVFLIIGMLSSFAQERKTSEKEKEYQYAESGFETGKQYLIIRFDGVEYIGEIISDDNREILLKSNTIGEVYIPKFEIKKIIEIEDEKSIINNEYMSAGPFTTRYSFTTNALPIKKGENYGMLNLFGPEAHLAITDNFNIGGMATWIASPVILATKYSFIPRESKVNFSFGTLVGTSGYLNKFKGYGGLHWLNITIGDRKNNFTFSGGYAYLQTGINQVSPGVYIGDEYERALDQSTKLAKTSHGPVFSIAGIFKIGAKASFVFDSMIGFFDFEKVSVEDEFNEQIGDYYTTVTRDGNSNTTILFLMPGVRFQNTDRKAFQICVAGASTYGDLNVSFPIPMCSWFYKF